MFGNFVNKLTNKLTNKSTEDSTNKSINNLTDNLTNKSIDKLINDSIDELTNDSIEKSIINSSTEISIEKLFDKINFQLSDVKFNLMNSYDTYRLKYNMSDELHYINLKYELMCNLCKLVDIEFPQINKSTFLKYKNYNVQKYFGFKILKQSNGQIICLSPTLEKYLIQSFNIIQLSYMHICHDTFYATSNDIIDAIDIDSKLYVDISYDSIRQLYNSVKLNCIEIINFMNLTSNVSIMENNYSDTMFYEPFLQENLDDVKYCNKAIDFMLKEKENANTRCQIVNIMSNIMSFTIKNFNIIINKPVSAFVIINKLNDFTFDVMIYVKYEMDKYIIYNNDQNYQKSNRAVINENIWQYLKCVSIMSKLQYLIMEKIFSHSEFDKYLLKKSLNSNNMYGQYPFLPWSTVYEHLINNKLSESSKSVKLSNSINIDLLDKFNEEFNNQRIDLTVFNKFKINKSNQS